MKVRSPLVLFSCLVLVLSCSYYPEEEDFKVNGIESLPVMEALLNSSSLKSSEERVILTQRVLGKIKENNAWELAPVLLSRLLSSRPDDVYAPWYLYQAALCQEHLGRKAAAVFDYRRVFQSANDVVLGDESIKYQSIQKLLQMDADPYLRINLYRALINNHASRINPGLTWYYLAKAYESTGQFKEAFAAYRSYLSYPGTGIPQKSNEERRIQEMLLVSDTKKNWTRPKLEQLIKEIRFALNNKDSELFVSLQSKVNFFAMSWLQEKTDFNSQDAKVTNNLKRFLETAKQVYTDPELDSNSNSQEAYLKTWGWNDYIPTWFLYFRRVDYPADPDIHGNWEWAGIYFGDSLQ